MKILQVIQFFSPKHGGSATVAYELTKQLAKNGHEVTVLTTDFELDSCFIDPLNGVEVIPFHCDLNIGGLLISFSMNKYLKENISKFDIIHMHNFRTYQNIIVSIYAKKYKIPYLLQAHGTMLRIINKKGFKYLFDFVFGYPVLKNVSKVIAVSNEEINQYLGIGVPKEKIVVIPNGIDIDSFYRLPEKGSFRDKMGISDKYIVLYLGRLHERKGISFLIEAYSELLKQKEDVALVLAGPDDGYRDKAELLIHKFGLKNKVKFTGYIDTFDKLAAYVDCDVLIYPSILEIFGLVPFEAIMCGNPVIVTDDCGCGEFIKKANCGCLVKYGDVVDLKNKMKLILENPDIGNNLVENGQKYIVNNLTWPLICKNIEIFYESCISKV